MSSLVRARFFVLAVIALSALAAIVMRPVWRGQFAADLEMRQVGGTPMRLGMSGGIGSDPAASIPAAPAQFAIGTVSAPFDGPTAAESAAIDNLRAAVHAQWEQIRSTMPPQMATGTPDPIISQPFRHLTPWEIGELNRNADQIRATAAASGESTGRIH